MTPLNKALLEISMIEGYLGYSIRKGEPLNLTEMKMLHRASIKAQKLLRQVVAPEGLQPDLPLDE